MGRPTVTHETAVNSTVTTRNMMIVGHGTEQYKLIRKLGSGAFGEVYLGSSINKEDEKVAVKVERTEMPYLQLQFEFMLYEMFWEGGGEQDGIPNVKYFGKQGEFNVMVMELLGPSIEDLFNRCGRQFTLKTVIMLALQMILRVEYVHSKNYIHRDIKPGNFLMGVGKKSHKVHLIDYGLAKRFRYRQTGDHIRCKTGKDLTGTPYFSSVNAHKGVQQSRRDDLESLGYTLVYLMKGYLPWQKIKAETNKQKLEKILEAKMSIPLAQLCDGIPEEFARYLQDCRDMGFEEEPQYSYLSQHFRILLHSLDYENDYEFDWTC
ncbi:unnamed protein product [Orchesella dallaii]|uniref:non-specific serine/threonine protein kinase n=1 Tax=Orchesella dallaii TaxID=48710 RepID=A0ABP1Q129_9HEXA